MHELSIAQNMVKIINEHLTTEEAPRLQRVHIRVGTFSTVIPELLQSGFEAATDGTPFEGAQLEINVIPLRIACNQCGTESEIEPVDFTCPHCSSSDVEIIAGNELTIADLEISETQRRSLHEH